MKNMSKDDYIIKFKSDGYDPFIDFMKGVCIIFVILTHSLPSIIADYTLFSFWGSSAVPLFLMLQVFHTYKQNYKNANIKWAKLFRRIIMPFLFTEVVIILIKYNNGGAIGVLEDSEFFVDVFKRGGLGPGAYYPLIYIQFAFVLPIFVPIFKKWKDSPFLLISFIIVSSLIEIICNIVDLPTWSYRILFIRYFFIIYIGFLLSYKGIVNNLSTILFSVLGIVLIAIIKYTDISLSPWVWEKTWLTCHWACFIYFACIVLPALIYIYKRLTDKINFTSFFKRLGLCSYEIFLFQMFYFSCCHNAVLTLLSSYFDGKIACFLGIALSLVVCVLPVFVFNIKRNESARLN